MQGAFFVSTFEQMNRILLSLTVLFFAAANAFSAVSDACTDGKKILNVRYSGLKETKPHVVERELLNAPGQIFSVENFHIEKLNLESLDLFSDVSLVCTESADGLDLEYRFTELWHWIPVHPSTRLL